MGCGNSAQREITAAPRTCAIRWFSLPSRMSSSRESGGERLEQGASSAIPPRNRRAGPTVVSTNRWGGREDEMATSILLAFETWDPVEFEKGVVRRLQAALTPSLIPPPHNPSDRAVIDTIAAMLADERVQSLLRGTRHDRFVSVIRAVEEVISRRDTLGDEETIAELWEFIDEDDLNFMLATGKASEQPEELLVRMFEGPYRPMHS
jgi:hypothetical protein